MDAIKTEDGSVIMKKWVFYVNALAPLITIIGVIISVTLWGADLSNRAFDTPEQRQQMTNFVQMAIDREPVVIDALIGYGKLVEVSKTHATKEDLKHVEDIYKEDIKDIKEDIRWIRQQLYNYINNNRRKQ